VARQPDTIQETCLLMDPKDGLGNNSKKAIYISCVPRLPTVFLFQIPLPKIPLPIPSFPTIILALVAPLPGVKMSQKVLY
jgi:hypothetical protein